MESVNLIISKNNNLWLGDIESVQIKDIQTDDNTADVLASFN